MLTTLPRAWVFTSPWQNDDGRAVRCHGSVLGYRGFLGVSAKTAFRNEGTGHCSGVDESSHAVVHQQEHWLQHTQTHAVRLLTQCNTEIQASVPEKNEPHFIGICLTAFFHKDERSSPFFHPMSQSPCQPFHLSTAPPPWVFLLPSHLADTSTW